MNIDKFGRHLAVGVTHQTNTDKFGRHISTDSDLSHRPLAPPAFLLPLTADGDYSVENRRLCNVRSPIEETDCANKGYVDDSLEDLRKLISTDPTTTTTGTSSIVRDLYSLRVDVNKWRSDQTNSTQSINDLTNTVQHIEQTIGTYDQQLSSLSTIEKRQRLELDEVEHKIRREHDQTKLELQQLIKSYDVIIQNLHKKVKSLEQQQQTQ